jgi:hypothetical protein
MRQEFAEAQVVVYGKLSNARLNPDGTGLTDLQIESILKERVSLKGLATLTIPRYIPASANEPLHFLMFGDVVKGRLEFVYGRTSKDPSLVKYINGLKDFTPNDAAKALPYFIRHLDYPSAEIATDAFLELAKAEDADIARAAPLMDAARLRKLLASPDTPQERIGLFGYILGACGNESDAKFLRQLIDSGTERFREGIGGLLAGYIVREPKAGWELANRMLADDKRSFIERYAVVGTMRFFQAAHPNEVKSQICQAYGAVLAQPDLADVVTEDLRRWRWWDLTTQVLAKYSLPGYETPIVQRAIIRYALSCPKPEAGAFVSKMKLKSPELIAEIAEGLERDK